jgi:hypothetical protein
MVKCSVFFAVRTDFLNNIYTSFDFKGVILIAEHYEANISVLYLEDPELNSQPKQRLHWSLFYGFPQWREKMLG